MSRYLKLRTYLNIFGMLLTLRFVFIEVNCKEDNLQITTVCEYNHNQKQKDLYRKKTKIKPSYKSGLYLKIRTTTERSRKISTVR